MKECLNHTPNYVVWTSGLIAVHLIVPVLYLSYALASEKQGNYKFHDLFQIIRNAMIVTLPKIVGTPCTFFNMHAVFFEQWIDNSGSISRCDDWRMLLFQLQSWYFANNLRLCPNNFLKLCTFYRLSKFRLWTGSSWI